MMNMSQCVLSYWVYCNGEDFTKQIYWLNTKGIKKIQQVSVLDDDDFVSIQDDNNEDMPDLMDQYDSDSEEEEYYSDE
eukprot:9541673-Ditylum_brightwellii.AAC.1